MGKLVSGLFGGSDKSTARMMRQQQEAQAAQQAKIDAQEEKIELKESALRKLFTNRSGVSLRGGDGNLASLLAG